MVSKRFRVGEGFRVYEGLGFRASKGLRVRVYKGSRVYVGAEGPRPELVASPTLASLVPSYELAPSNPKP